MEQTPAAMNVNHWAPGFIFLRWPWQGGEIVFACKGDEPRSVLYINLKSHIYKQKDFFEDNIILLQDNLLYILCI